MIEKITGESGLDESQAERLIPAAGGQLESALAGGQIDIGSLLGGGGLGDLNSKFDLGSLANAAGTDTEGAQEGLSAMLPIVMKLLQENSGAAELLQGLAGGDSGNLIGAAGIKFSGTADGIGHVGPIAAQNARPVGRAGPLDDDRFPVRPCHGQN